MVMITVPFITAVLALSTSVSGAYLAEPELEARNPILGAAGRAAGRMATGAIRNRVASAAPRVASKATGMTGTKMTMGLVGGKLFGGAIVGAGALGAQGVDNKINGRDSEELEARNPTLLRGVGRIASQVGRTAIRPQAIRPSGGAGGIIGKMKTVGAVTGIGLAAGGGEYYGGKHMGNAIDRLEKKQRRDLEERDVELEERDFDLEDRDFDEELWARNPALRAATRVAGQAVRASRTTVGRVAARPPPSVAQKVGGIAGKVAKAGGLAGAAAAGGYVEGGIQNLTPETQQKLKQDPKATIQQMLPANAFKLKQREYVEELVTRAIIGMMLEEDME
ncbi:hypothetical protein Hypma_014893 [Hypsizygus marmoreus]|uniref:Uncharacterized protein n=1 Tax=Hypsizygus marmoreus TaxID=39966 RepID=A0A369K3M0_HYPMA|nr:hypothetical protein Hypma_014893 [Hypsizygus marmoreus]